VRGLALAMIDMFAIVTAPGSGPFRSRNCRRASSGSSSCPRPTGRPARRRPGFRRERHWRRREFTMPPRMCMVKVLRHRRQRRRGMVIGLDLQDGGNEKLRVGRARIVKHPVGQTGFDHLPSFITIIRCDSSRATARSWVTTTTARPRSLTSPRKQIEQPRLHRDIETAGRLVHEDQPRIGDQVAGDLQPLPHAAGERRAAGRRSGRSRSRRGRASRSRFRGYCRNGGRRPPSAVRRHWRRRTPSCAIRRRVLVHEAPVGAHQEAPLGLAPSCRDRASCTVAHAVADRARGRRQPRSKCS
jgi:hypothetical protein